MGRTGQRLEVMTLGEALIVLDPVSRGALRHVHAFEKRIGGAELNLAVALCRLGHRAGWSGRLGNDEFGRQILSFLRGEGVDVSGVDFDPVAPTGVYFKERRALDRLRVYYYRAGSAASRCRFEDLDVNSLLASGMLHLTGITPALSEGCRDLTERLLDAAAERDVPVSFDANVRHRLFVEREPRGVLRPLVERADLLFLAEDEAEVLLGASDPEGVRKAQKDLKAETVVVHGAHGAFAAAASGVISEHAFPVAALDTVGAGDAFVAGFLSGRLRGWHTRRCLRLANACGACAVTVPGDAESMPSEDDALGLLDDVPATER